MLPIRRKALDKPLLKYNYKFIKIFAQFKNITLHFLSTNQTLNLRRQKIHLPTRFENNKRHIKVRVSKLCPHKKHKAYNEERANCLIVDQGQKDVARYPLSNQFTLIYPLKRRCFPIMFLNFFYICLLSPA